MKKATLLLFFISYPLVIIAMESTPKNNTVHLILTTALLEKNSQDRKKEYEKTLQQFAQMGYTKPYIVEGVQAHGPSFFEEHTDIDHIYYYPHNKQTDKNRGKFEGLSLAAALKKFNLLPQSLVYKQTGRYFPTKDGAAIVKEHPGFDAYVHQGKHYILLGAYIWKCEKLQTMLNDLDYKTMEEEYDEKNPTPNMIETFVTNYVKQQEQEKNLKVYYLQNGTTFGAQANPTFSSTGLTMASPTEY